MITEKAFKELEEKYTSLLANNKSLIKKNEKLEEELSSEKFLFNVLMEHIPSRIYFKNTKCEFIKVNNYLAKRLIYRNN